MIIKSIVPSRITEARESRAMSMEELADCIQVTRQSISKYERGIISPSAEMLQCISTCLDFPPEFFYISEEKSSTGNSPLFFRSNANIAKKVKSACKYQIKWTDDIKRRLEKYVDFIERNLPVVENNYEDISLEDIEELALSIRGKWGISDEPIVDVVGLLENQGVIIGQFAASCHCAFKGIDAFSCWKDGTPYILYNSNQKSAVRTRFSILHELGHLILHSSIDEENAVKKETVDYADIQADRFAAAFLLPATSFPKDIRGTSLTSLEIIKRKWGAALSTIIKRCETLDLLTENQINYLKRQMTTKKYWHKEPLDDELTVAAPEMLRDSILLLIDNHIITKAGFINMTALPTEDLKRLCGLPDEFFDDFFLRKKPVLRILGY